MSTRITELREIRLPLVAPFQTSFGVQTSRRILLVRAELDQDGAVVEGWGECVAGDEPTYSAVSCHRGDGERRWRHSG